MTHPRRTVRLNHKRGGAPGKDGAPEALRVCLLGGFRTFGWSRVIEESEWRLRKLASLVKLLALIPKHYMHRERVMELLWPKLDTKAAANNLHRVLYVARRTLLLEPAVSDTSSTDYLRLEGDLLALCPNETLLWVDVEAFEEAATARRLREPAAYRAALDLYAEDLLPGDLYEKWVQERRKQLRRAYLDLLLELAELYEEREELGPAVESLRQAVAAGPRHEEAHASLMGLYVKDSQRQQALRQYERLRQALCQELSVEPNEDTQRLYDKKKVLR
jgi:DNA-binding SARP family transcriptional activator